MSLKTWLCDDRAGNSVYIQARTWDEAQDKCFGEGLRLLGEHVVITPEQAAPPLWLTEGETLQ